MLLPIARQMPTFCHDIPTPTEVRLLTHKQSIDPSPHGKACTLTAQSIDPSPHDVIRSEGSQSTAQAISQTELSVGLSVCQQSAGDGLDRSQMADC